MENYTLTIKRNDIAGIGHIHINGFPTGFWIESGTIGDSAKFWYLQRPGFHHKQFAKFSTRRDVIQACRVFIEGATKQADESIRDMVIRALQSCLETGSTDIVKLTKP